jgi:hypothetical protein
MNGFNKLSEKEKSKILLNGFDKLSEKEKNKILLNGYKKLPQNEKNKILLKGYETLSQKEKNKILLNGYDKYEKDKQKEKEIKEFLNSNIDYNIVQTMNSKKNNNGLTQKEIEEWKKLQQIPKWKLKCMQYFRISEEEYNESKRRINNNHFRCSSMNYNKNPNFTFTNKIYGPYTIRGINDYNNDIKLFPLYRFSKQNDDYNINLF